MRAAADIYQVRATRPGGTQSRVSDFVVSSGVCITIAAVHIAVSVPHFHWFVVPVTACGVLIATDAIAWMRGKTDIFDPAGLIGLLGVHFFFLAPLLHVQWDHWMAGVVPPSDWRDWLGAMALLNFVGLMVYRETRNVTAARLRALPRSTTVWILKPPVFYFVLTISLLIAGAVQWWVYWTFGGIGGFMAAYEDRGDTFEGMGWLLCIAEMFPVLMFMGFVVIVRQRSVKISWSTLLFIIIAFFLMKMLCGGLRGSRSNTVCAVFWAVGMIHFWIRPVPRMLIVVGLMFLGLFMYAYGFYKAAGRDGLAALTDAGIRTELEETRGRGLGAVLLNDIGRSDVQAFLLYRLSRSNSDYHYAWGKTYLGAAALLIPRSIWPGRPPTKRWAGTEIQYGRGTFDPARQSSSRIYGLAGEAMLNFGPFAVPVAFGVLGWLVVRIQYCMVVWRRNDARWLLMPLGLNVCLAALVVDSDNLLVVCLRHGLVPTVLLIVCSIRTVLHRSDREL